MRILVVEDDQQLQRMIATIINRDPLIARRTPELTVAIDGVEGLAEVDRGAFDLVISDLFMPRMNGFDFCRQLRARDNGKRSPLIVTSSVYRDPKMIRELERETGAEFFAKPFQIDELSAAIRRKLLTPQAEALPVPAPQPRAAPPTSGALRDMPGARLLLELWDLRASGNLMLSRGKQMKDISIVNGTPVAVTSNMRSELLGHFLTARGVITAAQHQAALEYAKTKGERLGAALIALGFVKQATLLHELGAQLVQKLVGALRWVEGEYHFTPGSPKDRTPATIDVPRLVFDGLRDSARPDEILKRLQEKPAELVITETARLERVREAFATEFGEEGLGQIGARARTANLLAKTSTLEPALLIQIDVLLTCGLAVLRELKTATDHATPAPSPLPLASHAPTAPPSQTVLYENLFGGTPGEPSPLRSEEASGLLQINDLHAAQRALRLDELKNEVVGLYLKLSGKSYYDALGIGREATREHVIAAYERVVAEVRDPRFAAAELGEHADKLHDLESMLNDALEVLTDPEQRAAYDQALRTKRPTTGAPNVDAELQVERAVVALQEQRIDEACALLEEAAKLSPEQPDYLALLGWARYAGKRGTDPAREALQQALALDPEHARAHEYAAHIAIDSGQPDEALPHLEHLLDQRPNDATVLALYERHCTDVQRLERELRRIIHRLIGRGEVELTVPLWLRLGDLYRFGVGDLASALTALGVAAQLCPDDAAIRAAAARLYAESPSEWQREATELRAWWRLSPDDPEPGRRLFALEVAHERWDRALMAASALVHRGGADDETVAFARRYQPRFVQRLQCPLDTTLLDRLRHHDDDGDLNRVFSTLAVALPSPFSLSDMQLDAAAQIQLPELAPQLRSLLAQLPRVFDVTLPRLYVRRNLGHGIHVAATEPLVLMLGEGALTTTNKLELAFRLGRALSFFWPGRARANAIPTRALKDQFVAAIALCHPELQLTEGDLAVASLYARLSQSPLPLAADLRAPIDRLLATAGGKLNLSGFSRGLSRTADRIGFLCCGDLLTAAKIVDDEGAEGAVEDLIDFALSDTANELRSLAGISLEV